MYTCICSGEKPLRARTRINNKLNPHMTLSLGIKPEPYWWEARALTTAPSLLPTKWGSWKGPVTQLLGCCLDWSFEFVYLYVLSSWFQSQKKWKEHTKLKATQWLKLHYTINLIQCFFVGHSTPITINFIVVNSFFNTARCSKSFKCANNCKYHNRGCWSKYGPEQWQCLFISSSCSYTW